MSRITLLAIFAMTQAFSQLPPWLENYPGVTATVHSGDAFVESSYTTSAPPADVVEHYRKLVAAAGLPFEPNSDGIGTSIRAAAQECDLLIQIRSRAEGTLVKVNCSARTQPAAAYSPGDVKVISSSLRSAAPAPPQPHASGDFMEMHRQKVAEMGLHREHHDAPAPALIWPSWLVHVTGAALRSTSGANQAKDAMLTARYTTNVPMTEIYAFYRGLLNGHEYPARSSMSTGQTMTGVTQNALGYVEGFNYPDGAPDAYSTIDVRFSRDVLNGPITVSLRFTTHEYIAKRGY